eukprot:TRINITY_DN29954_c0_g1_i1.p1 TRINITY_DN29954_c0_g1~~TRINITY_DN29954_c0_g1_i1.p1  ORF type:complete len:1034 (-),score=157.47 TRINITY_DN29954_c0_g1_i1:360-3293(-)
MESFVGTRPVSLAEFVRYHEASIVLISAPEFGFDPRAKVESERYKAPTMSVCEHLQQHFSDYREIAYKDLNELDVETNYMGGLDDVKEQLRKLKCNPVYNPYEHSVTIQTAYASKFTSAVDFAGSTSGKFCSSRIHHVSGGKTIYGNEDFDRDVSAAEDFSELDMNDSEKRAAAIAHSFWVCFWRGATQSALKSVLISMPSERYTPFPGYGSNAWHKAIELGASSRTVIAVSIDGGPVTEVEKTMIPEICDNVVADLHRRAYDWANQAQVIWCCFPSVRHFLRSLDGEERLVLNTDVKMKASAWIDRTQDWEDAPKGEGILKTDIDTIEELAREGVKPKKENLEAAIDRGDSDTVAFLLEKAPHLANGEEILHRMVAGASVKVAEVILKHVSKQDLKKRCGCFLEEPEHFIGDTEWFNSTAVHLACKHGKAQLLRQMFKDLDPADIAALLKQPTSDSGTWALDFACEKGDEKVLDAALERLDANMSLKLLSEAGPPDTRTKTAFELVMCSGSVGAVSAVVNRVGSRGLSSLSRVRKDPDYMPMLSLPLLNHSKDVALFLIESLDPNDRIKALTCSSPSSGFCFLDELYDTYYDHSEGESALYGDAQLVKQCFGYFDTKALEDVDDDRAVATVCFGGAMWCGSAAAKLSGGQQAHNLQKILRRGLLERAITCYVVDLEMKQLAVAAADPADLRRVLVEYDSEGNNIIHRSIKAWNKDSTETWMWLFSLYEPKQLESLLTRSDARGSTCMHLACESLRRSCLECMRASLSESAWQKMLSTLDRDGLMPVEIVIERDDVKQAEVLNILLRDVSAEVLRQVREKSSKSDYSLLHTAVMTNAPAFKQSLQLYQDVGADELFAALEALNRGRSVLQTLLAGDVWKRQYNYHKSEVDIDVLKLILDHYDEDTLLAACERKDDSGYGVIELAMQSSSANEATRLLLSRLRPDDAKKLISTEWFEREANFRGLDDLAHEVCGSRES